MHETNGNFRASVARDRPGCLLAALSAGPAFAQGGDSGPIIGYVFDQTGSPLRGVKVTVHLAHADRRRRRAYTNDEGAFRFPQLVPGTFSIKAEAPKLRTVVQEQPAGRHQRARPR